MYDYWELEFYYTDTVGIHLVALVLCLIFFCTAIIWNSDYKYSRA